MELTSEWIAKFNRKCAEFLGWKHYEGLNVKSNGSFETIQSNNYFFNRVYTKSELKFHSDWNWMMEVIKKIESIKRTDGAGVSRYTFRWRNYISLFICFVEDSTTTQDVIEQDSENSKEEATIQAIDQFIDWYNQHK